MRPITIIIPVKDEESGLEFLLDDYQNSNFKESYQPSFIFVIDSRTSDSSRERAKEFSEQIIDQSDTVGKGAAMKQAIEHWRSNPTEITVFLDADGSYSFDSVLRVVMALEEGPDLVSGSRFISRNGRPEGMSMLHNIGNRFLSLMSSLRNRRKITDMCTGLWAFRKEALEKLEIKSNGFDLEAEIIGRSRINQLHHVEIAVDWSQRKGGMSKLRSFSDGFVILVRTLMT